jgi:hypothetical protein
MLASLLISIGLFFALLIGLDAGRRVGRRMNATKDDVGTGAAEGVIFAVFGLIVAFTFSASASRFNERRKLIVDQANALGTANLRLDALAPADCTVIRQKMLQWVQMAQNLSATAGDETARNAAINQAAQLQSDVWRLAANAVEKKQQPPLWAFVMSPINDWTDLSSTRQAMDHLGAPPIVMPTLIFMSLVAALLAGFHMSRFARQSLLHSIAFAAVLSFVMYVIFDLNHPRSGLIRLGSVDQSMAQTERSIKAAIDDAQQK